MWHSYATPLHLDGALEILADQGPAARIVAGGTDLILEIERTVRQIQTMIDVSRLPGSDYIRQQEDGLIHLGPGVTHNQIAGSALCQEKAFPLACACWQVGAPQIRNRGTLTGNLVTASPANDAIPALTVLDGRLQLQNAHGKRIVPISDFYLGVRKTVMDPEEMITDIIFPPTTPFQRGAFLKLGLREAQAISVVNVAVLLTFDQAQVDGPCGGNVVQARIALGSVAPTVLRVPDAEQALAGHPLSQESIAEAANLAAATAKPIDDARGSAVYRKQMVRVFTQRALERILTGTEKTGMPGQPVMLWGETDGKFPPFSSPTESQNGCMWHTLDGDQAIETTVNGRPLRIRNANDKTLLRLLREDVGLTGTKEGCAEGECGACTVFLDGIAVMSCLVPAPRAHGSQIITVEGLGSAGQLHPVQRSFVEGDAVQCGYCTPGFIMSGASLLQERPSPTRDQVKQAITGNLCRCTGYYSIINAIEQAARNSSD